MSRIGIAIVNYRTPGLVIDCLRSLTDEVKSLAGCRVTVVENASGDDSAARIGQAIQNEGWAEWAELMVVGQNAGFAGGNNAAIRPLLKADPPPDYILLLNPDTYIRPGAVRTLVQFMEENPSVGIAGSRLEDPDTRAQYSAFRFPGILSELEAGIRFGPVSKLLGRWLVAPPIRDDAHECGWVAGASMIVRCGVFDAIGPMDDAYFLYYEETDFCLRARRAGWSCWYVPASRVVHLVGQSTGVTNEKQVRKRRPRYWFESRRRYFTKNYGRAYSLAVDAAFAAGFALWRIRRWLQRKPDPDPPHLLGDFVRFAFLPFPQNRPQLS